MSLFAPAMALAPLLAFWDKASGGACSSSWPGVFLRHVTARCDAREVLRVWIDPIRLRVGSICLIHSLHGCGGYDTLAMWRLVPG